MPSSTISPLRYTLDPGHPFQWTAMQEKGISKECPFSDLQYEKPDQFVARTYLQFLWLPESIMPLSLLVPSLLRVDIAWTCTPASSAQIHPLHTLLDPLLLTVRSVSNKYHVELPQILVDGGGAGEMEESMMWFAFNHEKGHEDGGGSDNLAALWTDEQWKREWLERLERREIQIQILLYFLKLSLPGPRPLLQSSTIRSPRRGKGQHALVVSSIEDCLESFMDKLSTWQLLSGLARDEERSMQRVDGNDEHDWMQVFCEDTVEPRFKTQLPELCRLLRNKVFPSSPFSDDDDDSRSSSPTLACTEDEHSSHSNSTNGRKNAVFHSQPCSLSVSLAQDAEARRARAGVHGRKVLRREVSMSRTLKPKRRS